MKILVAEKLAPEGLSVLKEHFEVDEKVGLSVEQLKEVLPAYDAVMVRSATKLTADVLRCGKKLKAVARAGVGVDNVDVAAATRQGILVLNAPRGNTVSAAELAVSLMLAALRKIVPANESLREGKWERSAFMGRELNGKTVGIIGLGPVGGHVARIVQGFGCRVLAFDPYVLKDKAAAMGVELFDLDALLRESDVVTVHAPLTPQTRGLISKEALSKMKDGVVVVNAARGGIVDEEALYEALQSGKVGAAGLDVFSKEPPEGTASKLIALPGVVSTPHLGASTHEAQRSVSVWAAEQLVLALQGRHVTTAVNLPYAVDEAFQGVLPSFIALSQTAGKMLFQLQEKPLKSLDVIASGDAVPLSKAIVASALKGFLESTCDANLVNAAGIAQEKGVRVNEIRSTEKTDYANLVTLLAADESGVLNELTFSLFSDRVPRLIRLNGFGFEARLSQLMLLVENQDVLGVVGAVGTVLAEDGVNIAELHLSRKEKGGRALSLINIDQQPSRECMQKLLESKAVKSARVLRL